MPQTIMPQTVTVNDVKLQKMDDGITIIRGWNAPIADIELALSLFSSPLVEIADDEDTEQEAQPAKE